MTGTTKGGTGLSNAAAIAAAMNNGKRTGTHSPHGSEFSLSSSVWRLYQSAMVAPTTSATSGKKLGNNPLLNQIAPVSNKTPLPTVGSNNNNVNNNNNSAAAAIAAAANNIATINTTNNNLAAALLGTTNSLGKLGINTANTPVANTNNNNNNNNNNSNANNNTNNNNTNNNSTVTINATAANNNNNNANNNLNNKLADAKMNQVTNKLLSMKPIAVAGTNITAPMFGTHHDQFDVLSHHSGVSGLGSAFGSLFGSHIQGSHVAGSSLTGLNTNPKQPVIAGITVNGNLGGPTAKSAAMAAMQHQQQMHQLQQQALQQQQQQQHHHGPAAPPLPTNLATSTSASSGVSSNLSSNSKTDLAHLMGNLSLFASGGSSVNGGIKPVAVGGIGTGAVAMPTLKTNLPPVAPAAVLAAKNAIV